MKRQIAFSLLFGASILCCNGIMAQTVETYESLMKSGNTKYAAQDYFSAKTYYEMALKQKPKDAEAQKKLNETIVKIQQDSERQERFYAHLDAGDGLNAQQKYEEALAEYEQALAIMPGDKYTEGQANTIRAILKERNDKADASNTAMELGNSLLEEENFDAAIIQFETAKDIYPDSPLPKDRLKEAHNLQKAYNEKVAQFDKLVEEANNQALRKNFDKAIEKLNQALEIFPNDDQVKAQLQAYNDSKDLNERYNAAVAEADKLYEEKNYREAKAKYQAINEIIPNDSYATDMVRRINELFESPEYIAEENYKATMARAADLEEQQQLQMALSAYQEALTYKAGDVAATKKVNEISATLQRMEEEAEAQRLAELKAAEEEAARLAAEAQAEAERQAHIQALLTNADNLLQEEQYQAAKDQYNEVLSIDEGNSTATAKINEINEIFARIARESQQRYDNAMASAQQHVDNEEYREAINQYQIALVAKPSDADATSKLAEVQRLEDNRVAALRSQYNSFIKEGDKQFAAKALDKAVENYAKAEDLGLNETYPTEMIDKINRIIEENKLYELNTEAFTLNANTPRRFTFNPVDVASRRSNYIVLKVRNLNPGKSFPMIISFGSDSGKNGGFVIAISESEDTKTYFFKIGAQYKWFSENNTWIELISENDDVEISLVEISRN